jgi:hypothetical protein
MNNIQIAMLGSGFVGTLPAAQNPGAYKPLAWTRPKANRRPPAKDASRKGTYADGNVVKGVLDAGYQSMRSGRWLRVKY